VDIFIDKAKQMLAKSFVCCGILVAVGGLTTSCRDNGLQGSARDCQIICEKTIVGSPFPPDDDIDGAVDRCASKCIDDLDEAAEDCFERVDEAVACVSGYDDFDDVWEYCMQSLLQYRKSCRR
jgi:hypothetical protein